VSISPKGDVTVLADKYEGKKFNSPNDLWIDSKGGVYFSDPRYGNREGMEQDGEHVYYLTPDRGQVIRVTSDLVRPNGVIGTPNGRRLYIADHGASKTYVYTVNKDGTLADKQEFAPEGSDGMTIDAQGNVYLTTKVVAVYSRKGEKAQEIQVPESPANVTFGGPDNQTLFITARTSLYSVPMRVKGAATPVRSDGQAAKPKAIKEPRRPKKASRVSVRRSSARLIRILRHSCAVLVLLSAADQSSSSRRAHRFHGSESKGPTGCRVTSGYGGL